MNLKECSLTNICSSPTCYFYKEMWCTNSEEIDTHVMGKNHSFYAFDLMIQFLAEEGFLDMHSDILLNLTSDL